MALLELAHVSKRFGGLLAVSDVSFNLDRGEILSMIGPNGAGKTTAFNCVGAAAASDHEARHRTHVPEHPPLRFHDGG